MATESEDRERLIQALHFTLRDAERELAGDCLTPRTRQVLQEMADRMEDALGYSPTRLRNEADAMEARPTAPTEASR